MSHLERSPLDGIILGLLAAFVVIDLTFLILVRAGSPLIGLAFCLVLLAVCVTDHETVRPHSWTKLRMLLTVPALVY